jgi:ribosomal RNA-processing protein 8
MFAVPGWSVSADSLKPDTGAQENPSNAAATGGKKRKRNGGEDGGKVTAANVADLWESVVEGKTKPKAEKEKKEKRHGEEEEAAHATKKQKKDKKKKNQTQGKVAGAEEESANATQTPALERKKAAEVPSEEVPPASTKQKKAKKDKAQAQPSDDITSPSTKKTTASAATTIPSIPPAPPKLTPLQKSMREKLISARFRHLNETLYTRPSEEAFRLFAESPEMFDEYHEGFRRQVKVWPENPVDSFLRDLRARAAVKQPFKGKSGGGTVEAAPLLKTHLPRTQGTCIVADLGCGDARLAESLQKDAKKLRLDVKSFDLQSPSPLVTKADIANLPLADGSVNVAIFCLALMGTNWLDFVEEAHRILHWKGELWVAEIKSRFTPPSRTKVVTHSVGNRRKNAKANTKADPEDDGAEDLAVEVDGADDRRRETDVSAFVEALRKRGFVLHGEKGEAVDLSNKMFVKMRFLKAAAPTKGKGVQEEDAAPARGRKPMLKWPNGKDEAVKDDVDEAKILKACLYKIR